MVAVMSLAFSLYIILKPINPYLALLALGWRIGEVVLQAGGKIPDYLLLTLSQSAAPSSEAGLTVIETLGQILIGGSTQALWLSFVFLSIGSLFNNFLFIIFSLLLASFICANLIASDLGDNSFVLYFSRSITPKDYLTGKFFGAFWALALYCLLALYSG